jgi:prevent-host-death family protein
MITATIHEAKTNFSALLKRASEGEEVIIVIGRRRVPIARLVPFVPWKASEGAGRYSDLRSRLADELHGSVVLARLPVRFNAIAILSSRLSICSSPIPPRR